MAIISKYSNNKIENILDDVMEVLHKNDVSVDLSLMVLGNGITHILNSQVPAHKREEVSKQFINALSSSISKKAK